MLPLSFALAGDEGWRYGEAEAEVEADGGFDDEESSGSAADALAFDCSSDADERFRCLEEDLGRARPRAPAEVPRMVYFSCAALKRGEQGEVGKERRWKTAPY